ncbi:glycoside hydrolase family 2 protein [Hymenobacter sp. RP-2-7]|uniref:Glycoside hydrolase family 2 protein n=1 Tax=Hymenobacter polaris TaxID=2682546 RepID=A0A7Y0ABA6_9BACT|nr:beta-galactosidase GalB [Hymenobacter polaris]NML64224.1 glycoside hydrolase family 2 protein [Hymenobacter polaris]
MFARLALGALLLAAAPVLAQTAESPRHDYLLQAGWKFTKGDQPGAEAPGYRDAKWQSVRIPHDWAISGPFGPDYDKQVVAIAQNNEKEATVKSGRTGGLPFVGTGWYRRALPEAKLAAGQRATLLFDGAMSDAHVFVNGKEVGFWPYGYNSFYFDITDFLAPNGGPNVLAVRLRNQPEASRWYPGAGLYRNVHLLLTQDVHVPVWGTSLTTPSIGPGSALVKLKTDVAGTPAASQPLRLDTEIRDAAGQVVAKLSSPLALGAAPAGQVGFDQTLAVPQPQLWSPETPVLYTATSKLYAGNELKDSYDTRFGIRSVAFEAGKGFLLNGQPRKFKGVCNHHDLGPLGAAINVAALRRQLLLLKEMGCDAIRTSHNMPAPELVALADELGMMLMDETFDEWKTPKVKNGYSQYFDEWSERDLTNLIHRDRNHPSVVMWSIGNEVPDQSAPGGNKILRRLQDIAHREDPTRPVTMGMDRFEADLNNFAALLDVPGFNYKPHRYPEAQAKLPQGYLLGSETASTVSSRGVYKFPVVLAKDKKYPDLQSSSYDVEACNWSQIPDLEFAAQDDDPYATGEFVWTGFDYLGEPTPYDEKWPAHSSYFGILDLAGLPKDRFYLYRARWNAAQPTLHLLPHWTWPGREGQTTPVYCYTNSPSAELFVNGKSQGRQTKSKTDDPRTRYRLMWPNVKYEPGTLKVVAYDATGKEVSTEQVRTAGPAHHLRLVPDAALGPLHADGQDLAYVTVRVEDKYGNLCPDAAQELRFKVSGQGSFRAVANGDATCLEPFQQPRMKAFHGQLVVLVQAGSQPGTAQLTASGPGLKSASVALGVQ